MRIKCLAQGNNIMLPGFEPSTSVSKTDILANPPICSMHVDTLRIMDRSLPAAWTTNRSLIVASRVKAFLGRPTNSDSTLPNATHLDGGVIGRHQCITSQSESVPANRHATILMALSTCIPSTTFIPAPAQPAIAMTYYTQAPTMMNSSAFHAQLYRL